MTSLIQTTPPIAEPLFLDEVKQYIRYFDSDQDAAIHGMIRAARERLDGPRGYLGRALMTQTWEYRLDEFNNQTWDNSHWFTDRYLRDHGHGLGAAIMIPLPPLQTIDEISYIDDDDVTQIVDPAIYRVVGAMGSMRACVRLRKGKSWPRPQWLSDSVLIKFTAGYGDANAVPEQLREVMLMMIAHRFENREQGVLGRATGFYNELPDVQDILFANRCMYEV